MPSIGSRRMPKRTSVLGDLLDLWNHSFFLPRGIEIVLYKGRDRRSGRGAGLVETRLTRMESDSSLSSSASSEDEFYSDLDQGRDDPTGRNRQYGLYGGRYDDRLEKEMRDARMYRRQRKAEKKHQAHQRKLTKREMGKVYALYICYVPPRENYGGMQGMGMQGAGGMGPGGMSGMSGMGGMGGSIEGGGGGYAGSGYGGSGYAGSGRGGY